ncbi:hypothetical protein HN51_002976 [Arachis hypogaea]
MAHISDIKLIRTDTTLDLSQKAEKGMLYSVFNSFFYTKASSLYSCSPRCRTKPSKLLSVVPRGTFIVDSKSQEIWLHGRECWWSPTVRVKCCKVLDTKILSSRTKMFNGQDAWCQEEGEES